MSKLLIIGAGWEQYALIKEAKRQGHYIIATHPAMNTDGFSLADRFFEKDSRDIDAHLEIAKTYEVDAVVTDNCDYSFYTAAVVSASLGLSFASLESAIFSNDKVAQRISCQKHNVTQPEFYPIQTADELRSAAAQLGFPLIIKPVDSRGTFGVTIVKDSGNLENAFFEALMNSPSRKVICERFIPGTLVTVDGFCFKNGHRSLTVASRVFEDGPKPITKEIIYPAAFTEELKASILEAHQKVVTALNYQYGHTHGEYIVTESGEVHLVECTNRGGGVYTSSSIVPNLTGINLNEILINQSLGTDEFEISDKQGGYMTKSSMLTFLDFEEGKVIKSINYDELIALPYVVKYRSVYNEDDMVESIENCASRHSMLVIEGANSEATWENLKDFKEKMKIEYYQL